MTDPSAAASTLHTACRAHTSSSPDYIFACAGGCVPGFFTETSAAKHWECMEWNFRTCLNTVHEGVKAMKADGKRGGRVVLTSSVLALMSFAGYSTYSPSKYAIRGESLEVAVGPAPARLSDPAAATGLAEALRNELQLYGISVHLFLPATIYSPGFENEQRLKPEVTKKIEGPDEGKSPDAVAEEMLKGARAPATFGWAHCLVFQELTYCPRAGLERNDFYITYEPVGHMLRNSRAITPRNNILFDAFWSLAGTVSGASLSVQLEAERRVDFADFARTRRSDRSSFRYGESSLRTARSGRLHGPRRSNKVGSVVPSSEG